MDITVADSESFEDAEDSVRDIIALPAGDDIVVGVPHLSNADFSRGSTDSVK